jgi:hypothetical protein
MLLGLYPRATDLPRRRRRYSCIPAIARAQLEVTSKTSFLPAAFANIPRHSTNETEISFPLPHRYMTRAHVETTMAAAHMAATWTSPVQRVKLYSR